MYPLDRSMRQMAGRQTGTTLIVALVLVLLATLLGLFAMSVGIFGQRISANDVRSRLVQQTAEGALSQGIQYINLNSPAIIDTTNTANWQLCSATDTTFPCGAVEQCANGATSCSAATQRRGLMYRFIGGGTNDVNGNGNTSDVMDVRSLPITNQLTTVGNTTAGNGYNVNYGVGALLCMIKTPSVSTDPTECTTDTTLAAGTNVVTLVATASIPGESAKTTLTTTIGRASSLYSPLNKPPVVASGTITTNGNFQIVTNPNSGGTGVPVSMWTRLNVDKKGTPNTCYMDSFVHNQGAAYEGSNKTITCDSCNCPSGESLSFPSSGNSTQQGIDIVDVDPNTPQCTTSVTTACKPNLDIKKGEFPCDLFQYVFGDQAWKDTDGDAFCETRITVQVTSTNGNPYTIGEDENYLLAKATYIVPNPAAPYYNDLQYMTQATITDCNTILTSSTSGMVWDQLGCGFKGQVGTPDAPVMLIEDGDVSINAGGRLFGLLYVRPAIYGDATGPLDPTTGALKNSASSSTGVQTGGTANLSENGHANIYGAPTRSTVRELSSIARLCSRLCSARIP
jgi:Tfp pilus assembly protein PilX